VYGRVLVDCAFVAGVTVLPRPRKRAGPPHAAAPPVECLRSANREYDRLAAQLLVDDGHAVTLHARNAQRARDAGRMLPAAEHIVVGDLARIEETRQVAVQANALGRYDAVIHNAGIGYRETERVETVDGLRTCSPSTSLPPTC
jgi:hypothetical protein